MSERTVEWIIANAINEQARGDPDALAPHIIAALERAGYCITSRGHRVRRADARNASAGCLWRRSRLEIRNL
jgi:hypothetical protein